MPIKNYLVGITFLLCGCSQTKVHLYTRYLNEQQTNHITQALIKENLQVVANNHLFPASINNSAIIYSPFTKSPEKVELVINTLANIGWKISNIQMLFSDNHHYKKDSFALLPLPDGVDPHAKTNIQYWSHQYLAQECETQISITLSINGLYQIHTSSLTTVEYAKGTWKITSFPYIELQPEDSEWPLYFELKSDIKTDKISKVEIFNLVPLNPYKAFGDCIFTFGVRL